MVLCGSLVTSFIEMYQTYSCHPTVPDKVCLHANKDHDYIVACFMMKHKIEKNNNTDDISCDFDSRFQ